MRLNICVEFFIAFIFIILNKTVSFQKGKSIDKQLSYDYGISYGYVDFWLLYFWEQRE